MTRTGLRRAIAVVAAGLCLAAAAPVRSHIIYGRPTLHGLTSGADVVAHVRILDPNAQVVMQDSGERRPVVVVELREVIKGAVEPGAQLRFATHGHGVAEYAAGEEAVVFLAGIGRSRELETLAATGLRWVSFQEHDARYALTPDDREPLLAALRGYVQAEAQAEPGARLQALRAVTLALLTSGHTRLAHSAVQDLVISNDIPLVTADDVPLLLERVVDSPKANAGLRAALLSELDRRGFVTGSAHWLTLLRTTRKPEQLQVIRAAGQHPSAEVDAALVAMLGGEDDEIAAAAALALGGPAHATATKPLAAALGHSDRRVRMAAIRALGRIPTPAARKALEAAAAEHSDLATRRRAAAEIRTVAR
jgi:hypothetical protein